MNGCYDDDWLDKFTFAEDGVGINVSLDFPFELSIDENSLVDAPCASEGSEVSAAGSTTTTTYDHTEQSCIAVGTKREGPVQQTVTTKCKKGPVSKYKRAKLRSTIPNISRGKPAALYVFPSFDKCDSLVYFPTAMSRLSNSGDMAGFMKLIKTHFHQGCITTIKDFQLDRAHTLKVYEIHAMLCPDNIECVIDTKVIENTIEATMVSKFTESKFLYETIREKLKGTIFQAILCESRSAYLRSAIFADAAAQEEFRQSDLPDSDVDFTVDASLHYKLTFDPMHRKVTKMEFAMVVNAMRPITRTTLDPSV